MQAMTYLRARVYQLATTEEKETSKLASYLSAEIWCCDRRAGKLADKTLQVSNC
jgi:hypothetical protein